MYPYKDPGWLKRHYVDQKMSLKDISALLKKDYGIEITEQALYNWCKKFDLLKFRGRGRRLGANIQGPARKKQVSPQRKAMEEKRRRMRTMRGQRRG